ncbi:hypothetical protein C922_03648 [Plasmodium inui San Antonio 1]|uniref:Pantothenate kinase n=1 Tax=Plasmodium inui San Antonio 1 TaxID=1237626 RepID=W7A9U6_9APIC|nr:hypothetical protein C922_03648 [Plasmodium inui San Antonio 1]EUD65924.1 hypothetical protein C922_03648 [Plasmodium inui San Antonio 1]
MLLTPGRGNNSRASHTSHEGKASSQVGDPPKGCKQYRYQFVESSFNTTDQLNTCALDIGGTLIKVVYLSDQYITDGRHPTGNTPFLSIRIKEGQNLHLHFFKTNELNETLSFLTENGLVRQKILLTGGGAHKYFFDIINQIVKHEVIFRGLISEEDFPLWVSSTYHCETSRSLAVELQLRESPLTDSHRHKGVPFSKSLLDSFPTCEAVRVYLVHPKAGQKEREGSMPTQANCEHVGKANGEGDKCPERDFPGELILQCSRKDEMHCVMNGLYKLLSVKKSVVRYDLFLKTQVPVGVKLPYEPFMIANIGSGISILLSNGPNMYKRIGGTAIGGGTLMGLAQLILQKVSFEELIQLASPWEGTTSPLGQSSPLGHAPPFDLTLRHIRKDAARIGAPAYAEDALAACFGFLSNIVKTKNVEGTKSLGQAVARSLIRMVSYNIGYLVHLLARIHGVRRLFFSGKYISNHECIMESLTLGVYYYYMYCHTKEGEANDRCSGKSIDGGSVTCEMQTSYGEGGTRVKPSYHCPFHRRVSYQERGRGTVSTIPSRPFGTPS